MADLPPAPTHNRLWDLLGTLLSIMIVFVLLGWQYFAAKSPTLPPEIGHADTALAARNEKKARREFDSLIAQAPDTPFVYSLVVSECLGRDRPGLGAVYAYRAIDACRYAPNAERAELYLALSELYLRQQPMGQKLAEEYSRRAVELDPENPMALNGYGYALLENTRSQQEVNVALGYIQKALLSLRAQTSPNAGILASVEASYGWGLYRRGQYDAKDIAKDSANDYALAVNELRQALSDLPEGVSGQDIKVFYYHLGAACRAAGRIEEARHALQIALFYDPKYTDALKEMQSLPPVVPAPIPASPVSSKVQPPAINGKPAFQPLDKPSSARK